MSSWYPRYFPADHYDANGIYKPRLHGLPWQEWFTRYGCRNMAEIVAKAKELDDERRMDVIGQNGNSGEHY